MTTPETRSVELEPLAPSFDERAGEGDEEQLSETDIRELPAYSFDSDDETLVGIGDSSSVDSSSVDSSLVDSSSVDSSMVLHFDSSDRTLVGIGPAELAELAELARLAELAEPASHAQQPEPAPESVPVPHSEPPGPFVAADDDDETALRLPMQNGGRWLLALPAVLVAGGAFALMRGVLPHTSVPRLHAAAIVAPRPVANEARTSYARFETSAAVPAQAAAVASPIARARETPEHVAPPPAAPRGKPPEPALLHASTKPASVEPALGALDVTSNPPSSLVLDGRPLGKTPRVVQLASGPHTVVFVHPARGRVSVTVNVRAGRTTSASADF